MIILILLAFAKAAPIEELVQVLPGIEQLTFGMYSGFIGIENTTKSFHYILAES
jgi:hypothetical protein